MTHEYPFPMAGVTATMVLWYMNQGVVQALFGTRSDQSDAYPGMLSLPGGYLNVGTERVLGAAQRETKEETTLEIAENRFDLFYIDDKPGDDPRYLQVVNLCYSVELDRFEVASATAKSDLQKLEIIDVEEILNNNTPLAFAHNKILWKFWNTFTNQDFLRGINQS